MACITVQGLHPYAIAFSPYTGDRLAVASAQNFGIAGKGSVSVFDRRDGWATIAKAEWRDGLFSVCWSETSETELITCSGDGSCQLWNTADMSKPARLFKAHTKEASKVDYCQAREGPLFASASWDQSVKVWDAAGGEGDTALASLAHNGFVYDVRWSPHRPHTLVSACEDGSVTAWDARTSKPAQVIAAHGHEALCVDWNRYDPNLLVSGSVDRTLRCFDLRMARTMVPVYVLESHQLAVRALACSPFDRDTLASGGYDMCAYLWHVSELRQAIQGAGHADHGPHPPHDPQPNQQESASEKTSSLRVPKPHSKGRAVPRRFVNPRPQLLAKHKEFVTDVAFNVFAPEIAHCSWDSTVCVHATAAA